MALTPNSAGYDMSGSGVNSIDPLWTEKEVAKYLRVEVSTVRTWVKRKGLPAVKVGSLNRFRQEDIDAWIEEQTAAEGVV